jgi:hypothetical protein
MNEEKGGEGLGFQGEFRWRRAGLKAPRGLKSALHSVAIVMRRLGGIEVGSQAA